jgi:hypothetical protein
MKLKSILALAAIGATLTSQTGAQTYDTNGAVVQTFAGSGFSGYVDGVGQLTMFSNPQQVVSDSNNNLLVWDSGNSKIRKIAPDSTVTTFITNMGTFNGNLVWTIDRSDTIWGVDGLSTFYAGRSGVFGSSSLYKITSGATVTTTNLFPVTATYFHAFAGICVDSLRNIYISDAIANVIYRYTTNGILSVFAGSGNLGYADGNGIFTAFNEPAILAADAANNIYVWDSGNYLIRRIDQSQNVTTFAGKPQVYVFQPIQTDGVGTNAIFNSIYQMCVDGSGNLILACGTCVRKISATTNVTTIAGSFSQTGYTNGAGNLARFNAADGVCISGGTIYVADAINQRIRNITNNPPTQPVLPANLQLNTYPGLQIVGTVGRTYQIQTSPDLNAWNIVATVLLTSSPYLWIDQHPVSGNKFYRALLLP